ncbi:hypothetical protein L1987_47131 [Smallanthus sonchifolius]|uniref:Uncharacterized protein n=1 Tax=Smallanthus sonchifolius TaxID=185202 RepID=A0ACB9G2N6_9ASTR|nr:hypothetical protein L1987_47131 [Smallanthus sonchifolius]
MCTSCNSLFTMEFVFDFIKLWHLDNRRLTYSQHENDHLRDVFVKTMGLDDIDIMTLSGGHSLGFRCLVSVQHILVGTVAREHSSPSLTVSFLIAGITADLYAFCFAELLSRCPSAGSAYHYSYTVLAKVLLG